MTTRVKAHKVSAGMRVTVKGQPGEWTVLSRHPISGHWWLHRWTDKDEWQTDHAHYGHMEQIISMPGEQP
jgi:hypothetical protein